MIAEKTKIWMSSPHMGGKEKKFVEEAFTDNWIAPLGPNVTGFEMDLEQYLGQGKKVAALSSGTAALHLALILTGVKAGDEVICQSMTFSASANPIVYLGARPVFVDSESETWNLCPRSLEKAIGARLALGVKPKAIIGVHLYGMPFKIDEIKAISEKYEIPLIEDCAEALGSTYKGRKCGTFGDKAILSFNGNKIITTSGGGALVTNTTELKEETVFLATQARDEAPHYQHSRIGYNYRLSNVSAGIGRGQMQVLDKHITLRRKNNRFYQDLFENIPGVEVFREPTEDFHSNHWLSCILIDQKVTGINSENLRLALEKENIESRPLWKPMHLQPVFVEAPYYGADVSEKLFKTGLCLPSASNLREEDLQRIQECILSVFAK